MKKYIQVIVAVLIVPVLVSASLVSCTDSKSESLKIVRKSDPIPVKILELESIDQSTPILTSGKITTDNETQLAFKTGGVLDQVFVQEGDRINRGQLLATLNLREINAVVSQSKFLLEKSQRDFERTENLFRDSVATLEQMQNARTALDVAREQLQATEFNKQFSKIVAPQNGFVLRKFVNPGQVIAIGAPVLLVNGVSNNGWLLRVNASDKQWAAIQLNNKANVTLDAFAGREFQAKVLRKSETSDPATGTFSVDLLVKNEDEKLVSGMFGSAKITTARKTKVWSVPYEAVLDANGNEGFVFVTPDYKTAIKVPVTISSIEKDKVSITGGFEKVSTLIVSGSAYLNDQADITIIK